MSASTQERRNTPRFRILLFGKETVKIFFYKCSHSGRNESTPQTQSNVSWISSKAELEISFKKTRLEMWVWESGRRIDPATGLRRVFACLYFDKRLTFMCLYFDNIFWILCFVLNDMYTWTQTNTHLYVWCLVKYIRPGTAYCIGSVISPFSKLNWLSSSLRLFRHFVKKRPIRSRLEK